MTSTDQIIITNIETICRSCLRELPNMLDLYHDDVFKMYMSCTTIKCDEDDGLPKRLCRACFGQIKHFHNFKTSCLNADAALKQHLKQIKIVQIKQEIIENLELSQELSVFEDPLNIPDPQDEIDILENDPLKAEPNEHNPNEMKIVGIEEVLNPNPNDFNSPNPNDFNSQMEQSESEAEPEAGEQYNCTICNKTFEKRSYLLKHVRRHPDYAKERFKCIKCKTEYTNVRDLNEHFKTHQGRNAIKCPGCIKNFYNYKRMQAHFTTVHIVDGDVTCTFCHTTYATTTQFRKHVTAHLTASPLKCNWCGQAFKSEANLKVHLKKHRQTQNHVCDVCDQHFLEKRYLQRHLKTHSRGQSFFCDTCEAVFDEKSLLINHLRIHSGENLFKCPSCNIPCYSNEGLQEHLKTHQDDRPYICKVCSKSFKLANTLIRHILTHPGQEPYKCNECGMRFMKKMHLKTHKMKHY